MRFTPVSQVSPCPSQITDISHSIHKTFIVLSLSSLILWTRVSKFSSLSFPGFCLKFKTTHNSSQQSRQTRGSLHAPLQSKHPSNSYEHPLGWSQAMPESVSMCPASTCTLCRAITPYILHSNKTNTLHFYFKLGHKHMYFSRFTWVIKCRIHSYQSVYCLRQM